MPNQPEAFSRVLIDKELENSQWNLLDSHQVRFESHMRNGVQTTGWMIILLPPEMKAPTKNMTILIASRRAARLRVLQTEAEEFIGLRAVCDTI